MCCCCCCLFQVSRQFTEFLEGGAATAFITQLLTALRESPGGEETAAAAFRAAIEAFFAALTGRGVQMNTYKKRGDKETETDKQRQRRKRYVD